MRLKLISILLTLIIWCAPCDAQPVVQFVTFKNEVRSMWAAGDITGSIKSLDEGRKQYHKASEQHTIIYYLGLLYLESGDYKNCFTTLKEGFDRGFFFSFWPAHTKQLLDHNGGDEIVQLNRRNQDAYLEKPEIKYEIILPTNFEPTSKYPVLYFFHGNNSNLQYLLEQWDGVALNTDIITVLVQSPFARSNFAFDWIDDFSSRAAITSLHDQMLETQPIDSTKVIFSGFSNGGRMAIDMFLNPTISSLGFIAFNPSIPKSLTLDNMSLPLKGRGTVVTGAQDYMLIKQKEMVEVFSSLSMPLKFVVNPSQGHDYPIAFEKDMIWAIEFILNAK